MSRIKRLKIIGLFSGIIILAVAIGSISHYLSINNRDTTASTQPSVIEATTEVATTQPSTENESTDEPKVIELTLHDVGFNFKDMVMTYQELHPELTIKINHFTYQNDSTGYRWLMDQLSGGTEDVPDMMLMPYSRATDYIRGDLSQYIASYEELGIEVDKLLQSEKIPQYIIDLGTNEDGELVALPYQSASGAFIYRRSIALDVWGTDDPVIIGEKIGPGWEKFFEAAGELKANGYGIVSGPGDIWNAVDKSADMSWVVNGKLTIDPKREAFLDLAKELIEKGYTNETKTWDSDWFMDMQGAGDQQIFGYIGPSWMANFLMVQNSGGTVPGEGTYGDWAVCLPPMGAYYDNMCIVANKDTEFKKEVADIIQWLTLDSSETGFQYRIANGIDEIQAGLKDSVPSGRLMKNTDASFDFLGGQNMFDIYLQADHLVNANNVSLYDDYFGGEWCEQAYEYAYGNITKEQAIENLKAYILEYDFKGVTVE